MLGNDSNGIFSKSNDINFGFNDIPELNNENMVELIDIDLLEPAPKEWNFYKPLNNDKLTELLESIERNGLLNPIVVWALDDDPISPRYMILSGHNRKKAFEMLRVISGDKSYDKIPALIKGKDEITEEEAREIIIDTNWVQRTLSQMEKARSVIEKYAVLQSKSRYASKYNAHGKGKLRDVVAEEYNISGRQVERYRNLSNLIDEIQTLALNNEISLTPAYEVAKLDKKLQLWIYENHKDKINMKYTRKLKSHMTYNEVKDVFEHVNESKDEKMIGITVPTNVFKKYNSLSLKAREELKREILNLLISYTEKMDS